jgi:hypothetical protein
MRKSIQRKATMDPKKANAFYLRFPMTSKQEANVLASGLADEISEIAGIEKAKTLREDPQTQDFGATLVLLLGTASVTAVANGIRSWLSRKGVTAEIYDQNQKIVLRDVRSQDIAEIVKAFSSDH